MRRRQFLTVPAASLGGRLYFLLDGSVQRVGAQPQDAIRVPLRFFDKEQALDVGAAAARIFPSDETGPGAAEAGVVIYIDRQLAGPYGNDRYRYTNPPFAAGPPELGYQGEDTPRAIYTKGAVLIKGMRNLSPADQDARLHEIEKSVFFDLLRRHTIEGMFCDPMHGGNADKIGWQMIGFPGPRMSYFDVVDTYNGRPFRPKPESLAEILGRPVRPSEEERE